MCFKGIKRENDNIIDLYYISQLPDYPTGCEGVSAVMLLRTAGVFTTPEIFFQRYLDIQSYPFDPDLSYGGNPSDNTGLGCYAPALSAAMNKALDPVPYTSEVLRNYSIEQLCQNYIINNNPVIIWASVDMSEMKTNCSWNYNGKIINWKSPEHCLVLIGFDENNYIFNDPMRGKGIKYSKEKVEKAYKEMGCQAIIIKHNP